MTAQVDVNAAFAAERAQQISTALDAPARARAAAAARNNSRIANAEAYNANLDKTNQRIADDNAKFDQRVADGKMRDLGNGRFEVTDPSSWDNGEILTAYTMRQALDLNLIQLEDADKIAADTRVILPEHGLDLRADGNAAVYSSVPMWHDLGTVIPGGTTSIEKVMEVTDLNHTIVKRPVLFQNELTGPYLRMPDQWVTVRDDTAEPLGVVGSRYEVVQNWEVFAFLQELTDNHGVVWESAGKLRNGARVFVSMRLPENITIDAAGINDTIVPFIVTFASHDGRTQNETVVTPWRPVCGNTERFAVRDAYTRWGVRHTVNVRARIAEARRTLGLSVDYYKGFEDEENALAQTGLTIDAFRKVVADVWPAKDDEDAESERSKRFRAAREEMLIALYGDNAAKLGATAYAGERAITEYTDHKARINKTGSVGGTSSVVRATRVIEGSQDDTKARAHRRLLTLVRR